ncbi:acyltransferase [Avibacterium avium]|uniref:acyltransferase n=1 Tax=Avibacterium avium TaxID=751 RepID=UPI003BF7B6AD
MPIVLWLIAEKKELISGNYYDTSGNKITAPNNLHNCHFQFLGGGNQVTIHPNANLRNVFLEFLGHNSKVYIGENVSMKGQWCLGVGCTIKIGSKTTSTNPVYITVAEHTTLSIGEDCMFATNNQIRTDDAHPIYDVRTGKRLNTSKDIIIGDRVWVAYGATIWGGSQIGNGSIVGAYSVVKKRFPNNCIIAGVPAKIIRKDVFWERNNVLYTDIDNGIDLAKINHLQYSTPTIELE